jgi:thiol-disulfide isomerase/thioredoxin
MKNLLLSIITLSVFSINAQTTLTTAVDFTAKDIEGNTFNLFSKLGEGKYVLVDFFFTNCGPCQSTAPKLHEAFMTYGANNPDAQVYFVSINRDDNNAVFQTWESTYMNAAGPYPRGISGTEGSATGGPQTFSATYGISAYPTMILIAPDQSIVEQDIWPITSADDFDPFFTSHGITPFSVGISDITTDNNFSIFPSPAKDQISLSVNGKKLSSIRIFNILGNVVMNKNLSDSQQSENLDISNLTSGIYYAEVKVNNANFIIKKFVKE